MELSIEGTPEEIKNVLQAICGSEEHENLLDELISQNKRKIMLYQNFV